MTVDPHMKIIGPEVGADYYSETAAAAGHADEAR